MVLGLMRHLLFLEFQDFGEPLKLVLSPASAAERKDLSADTVIRGPVSDPFEMSKAPSLAPTDCESACQADERQRHGGRGFRYR